MPEGPPRRGPDRDRSTSAKPGAPRAVRKIRNEHGTRVARRIVCAHCGKSDTVDFAPRDPAATFCRACAFTQLNVVDPDERALRTRVRPCSACGRPADVDRQGPDILCGDCFLGIESQQQNRTQAARRVTAGVVRVRRDSEKR